ncbi:hypothetical protein OS42_45360 [Dickeya oryzae]
MTEPIFMVGARGCGKTTVGRELARALGYEFVDTDIFYAAHQRHDSGGRGGSGRLAGVSPP